MQVYPAYGYQQRPYVFVEEDGFVKDDKGSTMQMMSPNQRIPTPPLNHIPPPRRGGYYDDSKPWKGGYDSFKVEKPSYGGNAYEYGGWSNNREHSRPKLDGGYKYDYMDNVSPLKKSGGYHQGPPHMPPVLPNEPVKLYDDDYRLDGGYKYDYMDNPSPLKMGGGGGNRHGPPQMPPVEPYGDDYDGENQGHYWEFRGIDD